MNTRPLLYSFTMAALVGTAMTAVHAATPPADSPHHKAHHAAPNSQQQVAQPEARADALDRMHMETAALRDAEQQRQIAHDLRSGHLTPVQASMLEQTQAKILTDQAALQRHSHESVDQALRLQHEQDVQDWAIHAALTTSTTRT